MTYVLALVANTRGCLMLNAPACSGGGGTVSPSPTCRLCVSHILALRSHLLMMAIGPMIEVDCNTCQIEQTAQTAAIVHHRQQLPPPPMPQGSVSAFTRGC